MSENESFIDEVTEEVRRDKLYLFLKKYGWVAILMVIIIVSTSIFVEFRNNARVTASQKLGDFLTESLTQDEGKSGAFDFSSEGLNDDSLIALLLKAKHFELNSDYKNAKISYNSIINNSEASHGFSDFVKFKLVLLLRDQPSKAEQIFNELITPNNPFRLLALEQKVLFNIAEKKWKEAQKNLDLIKSDPSTTQGLQSRVNQIQKAITFGGS